MSRDVKDTFRMVLLHRSGKKKHLFIKAPLDVLIHLQT